MSDQPGQPGPPAVTPPGGDEPATCYRHPAREAHVRCARCNRRICPDCMIDAAVGFQCPECVREGNATVRQPRTTLGGRVTDGSGTVTKAIIAINVVVFFIQQVSTSFETHLVLVGNAFDPVSAQQVGVADGEYYRLITAAFMHAGFLHIAFNMYALYLFGPPLESALGRARYLTLFLLSALGGSAASYAFNAPNQASLGASGAVFGLLGAFFIVNRKFGQSNAGLFVLVAINLGIAFVPRFGNIDWHAHVGGLITGALVGAVMVYAPRNRRNLVQAAGCVVVLLVIVAVIAWRTAQLT